MDTYLKLSRRAAELSPYLLSVLRIVLALLFIEHGSMKLFHFPYSDDFKDLDLFSLVGLAGVMEFVCGLLLLVGVLTRPVAFLMSGLMAAAYFMVHAPKSFFPAINMGEPAVIYCFLFLFLAAAGGGAWSLSRMLAGSSTGRPRHSDRLLHPAE